MALFTHYQMKWSEISHNEDDDQSPETDADVIGSKQKHRTITVRFKRSRKSPIELEVNNNNKTFILLKRKRTVSDTIDWHCGITFFFPQTT